MESTKFNVRNWIIHGMNELHGLDMNLLVVLDALLSERHVSRAAIRINKSQPAVSHALRRLRLLLNDPLLVRIDGKTVLTVRALEIAHPLRQALATIDETLREGSCDPAKLRRTFRISMSDYGAHAILLKAMSDIRRQAPNVALEIVSLGRNAAIDALVSAEIDLAIGVYPDAHRSTDQGVHFTKLFEDRYACFSDTRMAHAPDNFDSYLERSHVAVAVSPRERGDVDNALAEHGRSRKVLLTLPYWSVAASVIPGTDLLLTAARRSLPARPADGLVVTDVPFSIPPIEVVMGWHERRNADRGHVWLRTLLSALFQPTADDTDYDAGIGAASW